MAVMYIGFMFISLICVNVHGRAVNISSTWFLPQEGFPVFYRYFKDKVTWNEADAICEFHHGDLITVDTSSQMDAARAYLKELDVLDHIWIGLMRQSSEKPFTWMNGDHLSGDGFWLEPSAKTDDRLCAALDPTSDYRWVSYHCGGPQVASFICELSVPDWAKKEDGCMITSLPSLTVTLVPEMGVIELFSDCGLDGTRRIACKGGVDHEEIIKRLSCDEDAFSTIFSKSTTDLTKETDTQSMQSAWTNSEDSSTSHITTKGWSSYDPYEPQTRHRRDTNPSSPGTTQTTSADHPGPSSDVPTYETSDILSTVANVTEVEILNVTINPLPKQEKMIDSKPMKNEIPTEKPQIPPEPPMTRKKEQVTEKTTIVEDPVIEPIIITTGNFTNNEESLIIITGETLNRSATINSPSVTSENPQIVVVIGENDSDTNKSDPYIVSLSDDIIINNNPSISPIEVIDVDVVELDKLTTKSYDRIIDQSTTTTTTTTILPNEIKNNNPSQSSLPTETITNITVAPTVLSNKSTTTTTTTTTTTSQQPTTEKYPENVGELEEEKGDESDVPQRPNRGRLFTHSNHPSFYPYFLNRVLG